MSYQYLTYLLSVHLSEHETKVPPYPTKTHDIIGKARMSSIEHNLGYIEGINRYIPKTNVPYRGHK